MKTLIKKILDNAFLAWLFSSFIIFLVTIPSSSFSTAIAGSMLLGLLALPIAGFVLSLIDSLLHQ